MSSQRSHEVRWNCPSLNVSENWAKCNVVCWECVSYQCELTSPAGLADAASVDRVTALAVLFDAGTAQLAAQTGRELVTPQATKLALVASCTRARA